MIKPVYRPCREFRWCCVSHLSEYCATTWLCSIETSNLTYTFWTRICIQQMKFLGQGFQKLEHGQYTGAHRRDRTHYQFTASHSRMAIVGHKLKCVLTAETKAKYWPTTRALDEPEARSERQNKNAITATTPMTMRSIGRRRDQSQ